MRKKVIGTVLSDKNDKTRIVSVPRTYVHPKYSTVIKVRKKIHCHDEKNISSKGDSVVVMESRPFSKLKRWVVVAGKK